MVMTKNIKIAIEEVLEEIRPMLHSHGGDIELVEWLEKGKTAQVRFVGGCATCPMAQMTFKNLVEASLKEKLPEIKKIELV
ncbi:MAG: NifU family protein [Patescibacteria group bacterium]|nr:NifU family protein [Patescibacteria group bacterium]MDD5121243.1 NifU family protein [Patescibacteria group bacterium]MDD5222096.1 NifU family protein [Patescibacteria group bacterium]MDD5395838.1 NifU family protein [Patescibacteria group bacterium]